MKPKKPNITRPPVVVDSETRGEKPAASIWGMKALVISILAHVAFILLAIFVFFKWINPVTDTPPDFAALGGGGGGSGETAHKVQAQARKAATMSDQSRRVATNNTSDFILPEPSDSMLNASLPQVEGGAGSGSGSGGGTGSGKGTGIGSGVGPGSGNGRGNIFTGGFSGNVFFNQPLIGKRAVFVLDYSRSMQVDDRQGILQRELTKVITGLQEGKEFQVILFAGYSWVPGDAVDLAADQMSATVKNGDKVFNWSRPSRNSFDWLAVEGGNKHFIRPVEWQKAGAEAMQQTMTSIQNCKLQMGTCWEIPLEMALEMKPAPEVIFFMTDGITGDSDANKIVSRITRKAEGTRTVINTISMMEPTEVAAMKELAAKTGGGFSIVQKDGKANVITKPKAAPASEPEGAPGSDLR